MTIENQIYGVPHWIVCARCGVKQPPKSLKAGVCINTVKCAEWKATLEKATAAAIAAAAHTNPVKP